MRLLSLLCALAVTAAAQQYRATLNGRITDPQGAAIAKVKVVAIQTETGSKFETVSGDDGLYTIPFLPPSSYQVVAEASGFKKHERTGIQLGANEIVALDMELAIGQMTETVSVTAEAPILTTATASSGQVITTRQIENMPLSGRTPLALAQLAFGVTPTDDPRFTRPFDNAGPSGFSMGGSPSRSNELLIDGAPDTTGDSRVAYNPPVDAVAEVKAESFQADAAYGHTGGGTVNVVLKSGTNQFHGTLYEFNQISNTAATPFFTNKVGGTKPSSRFNQYGGTFSGPVLIPKLVDGRNRVFFFFAYEGIQDALPAPATATMPTTAQKGGDFSALLNVGTAYQIFDPATGVAEGARVRRQPFPNNVIPNSRLSPIAQNYLKYYADPNQPGRADGQDNFVSLTNGERNTFYNYLARVDLNLSDRNKLFVNFRTNKRIGQGGNSFGKALTDNPTATNALRRINWGIMLDDVYTLTPTFLVNTRLNWTRFEEPRVNYSEGFDSASLGFPAYLGATAPSKVLPRITFSRFTGVGDSGPRAFPFDSFQLFESFTKILSRHTLKFGADIRQLRESDFNYGFSNGTFTFGNNWTQGPLDNSPAAPLGQDLAAFLLGLPTSGQYDLAAARSNLSNYYAFFLQDDFRVRTNLTLNLGLRAERESGTTERFDRTVNGFNQSATSPISAAAERAYAANPIPELSAFKLNGGVSFAGQGSRLIYSTPSLQFSPRFGLAWTVTPKTVLRGGVGIYYFTYGVIGNNAPGFSQTTALVPTLDGYRTPRATLANPFPSGIEQPTGSSLGLATFLGRGVTVFNPQAKSQYSGRWELSVQRELSRNTVLEVGYMGNKAVRLPVDYAANGVPVEYLSTLQVRDQATINRLTSNVPNPMAGLIPGTPLNGTVVARNQLLRAYPQFSDVTLQRLNDGSSHYHAMQVRLERRFTGGLQLMGNYQWSKLLERRSRLNDQDPFLEKRLAAEDRTHRLVVSSTYDLPFGPGKQFASNVTGVARQVVGGWNVNTILTFQPGSPYTWGNVIYLGGPLNNDGHNPDRTFDTSVFNRVNAQQLEWNRRTFPTRFNDARADGVNQVDLSIIKAFPIRERLSLTYRCEFFNLTNTPIFSAPNLSPTNTNFGLITNQANQPRRIQMALRLVF
ncbi:MAG: TonB-dependent receptor [Bryobacterales bacterium]|nr:TonB-dependent receptor [Bryobacterales bacterium]